MKKPLKIIIIIVAILLALFAAAYLILRSYLTDERIRALVSEMTEKSLNRKTAFGAVRLSLFRGIVVRDVDIKETDAATSFVRAKECSLMYQFLPLLSGRLVIDRLSLVEPEIRLRKNPDGSWNFSDLGAPGKERKEEAAGLPFSLNVKRISIADARLDYADPAGKLKAADLLLRAELGIGAVSEKSLSSAGAFTLTVVKAVFPDGNREIKDIRSDVKYKLDLDMEAKRITVHSADADVMKIPLQVRGSVDYAAETAWSLDMNMKNADLANIRKDLVSAFLPGMTALGGNATAALNVTRKPERKSPVTFHGDVQMSKVSFTYKGVKPVLDGSLKLTPEVITIEGMKLTAGQNSADVTGTVSNYSTYPDANIQIRSRSLALDDLFVPAPPSPKTEEGAGREPEPMNLQMRINAALDIDRTQYRGMAITNLRSRLELNKNILRVLTLSGNTLGGSFALRGAVDLARRGTGYTMTSDLKGVRIEELVNAFAPKARGKLLGILSGKAELAGAGTLPANVKRNLKGKGSFAIRDGSLRNAELSAGLLAFLGLQELREIPIQTAEGRFTVSGGIVNLTTVIAGRDLALDQTGTVGLDEKLDLGVVVKVSDRLAPKLVSQSAIARFLSSEKGWTSLPLRVGGTISQPSYGVDTRAVGKKAGEGIQKRLKEELFKRLPQGPAKTPADGSKQPPETEPKKIPAPGDLLKDLFGK